MDGGMRERGKGRGKEGGRERGREKKGGRFFHHSGVRRQA